MAEVEAHFFTKEKEKIPYYFNGKLIYIDDKPCLIGMGIDISNEKKQKNAMRSMETENIESKSTGTEKNNKGNFKSTGSREKLYWA